jgi:hypothetical protein
VMRMSELPDEFTPLTLMDVPLAAVAEPRPVKAIAI